MGFEQHNSPFESAGLRPSQASNTPNCNRCAAELITESLPNGAINILRLRRWHHHHAPAGVPFRSMYSLISSGLMPCIAIKMHSSLEAAMRFAAEADHLLRDSFTEVPWRATMAQYEPQCAECTQQHLEGMHARSPRRDLKLRRPWWP